MSIGIYDQIFAYWNGALLAENTTVKIALEGQAQDVNTTVKGYAGFTPGPQKIVVTFENVLPIGGAEVNSWGAQLNSEIGELKLQAGGSGKVLVSEGDLRGNMIDGGVGQTTTIAFEFHGAPADWT